MKNQESLIYLMTMPTLNYEKGLLKLITKAGAQPIGRQLRRKERQMQRGVDAEFAKQKEYIIKRAKTLVGKSAKIGDRKSIDDIFDDVDDEDMIDKIILISGSTISLGASYRIRASRLAQIGISFDLEHPLAVEYLKSSRPLVLAKMKDTTKEHIKPILQRAVEEGWSPQQTAKEIGDNYAFSKTRSLMIASNEVGHAYEWGNFSVMNDVKEKGYTVEKSWSTVNDDRVEQVCLDNQAEGWIKLDDKFQSGDDSAPTNDHPNCRCTTLYQYQ